MKKILISLLSIIFIISMITNVYAATGNISSGSSTDTVYKGKTFTVNLAGTADSPIDGMYTKFSYDKNVLSLESSAAGTNYGNNSSDGEILVTNNSSSTSSNSATLYTMTFKVLDTANVDSTTISFDGSELHLNVEGTVSSVSTSIASVKINIKTDDTTAGGDQGSKDETPSKDNTSTGTSTGDKSNSGNKTSNKKTNTTNKVNKLPQTGVENTVVIAIVALGIVSIVSYISYRKYNNI